MTVRYSIVDTIDGETTSQWWNNFWWEIGSWHGVREEISRLNIKLIFNKTPGTLEFIEFEDQEAAMMFILKWS
jgi:hypothetical protein